ncbi:MAG: hypothetical protein GY796_31340 [Chloroflexi bacterium]|nr:hypothetical protein [Chloroflexota bacterium]
MIELLQRWSVVILAMGLALSRNGSENSVAWMTGVGISIALVAVFFILYQRLHNLGWIIAIIGGSLIMLGGGQNSSLFGNPIQTPNSPLIIWGIAIALSGIGIWAALRSRAKAQLI